MTEPLPENIRRAGFDALQELSARMARGSASLAKQAALLMTDDPKIHRGAVSQLRRYQTFKMPCSEEVAVIEGAMMGLTEAESRALSERRSLEKFKKDQAQEKAWAEIREAHALKMGSERASDIADVTKRIRALEMSKARPGQNGNVIDGPWDTDGEARP